MEGYGNENPGAFQPTRPLRGTTENNGTEAKERNNFNPRAPCGARHKTAPTYNRRGKISTHAPLAGHDCESGGPLYHRKYFNPRAPCGARRSIVKFNNRFHVNFNPRAPCGARQSSAAIMEVAAYFNPRAPCGARHRLSAFDKKRISISTHAPLAGHDIYGSGIAVALIHISTHAPLAGHDSSYQ